MKLTRLHFIQCFALIEALVKLKSLFYDPGAPRRWLSRPQQSVSPSYPRSQYALTADESMALTYIQAKTKVQHGESELRHRSS